MRWVIEVSSVGKADRQVYCVESESWQRALQAARGLREDHGPMTGFSIELLNEGFSAIDPRMRLRYFVKLAPDDAPLTGATPATKPPSVLSAPPAPMPVAGNAAAHSPGTGSAAPAHATGSSDSKATVKTSVVPLKGHAKTVMFGSTGAAAVTDTQTAPAESQPPREANASRDGAAPASTPHHEVPRPSPASVRAASVPPASIRAASVPPASAPAASVPPASASSASAPPVGLASLTRAKSGPPRPEPHAPSVAAAREPGRTSHAPLLHVLPNEAATAPAVDSVPLSRPPPPTLPGVDILYKREQDPDSKSPLTYREYVYCFPAASDEAIAKAMLLAQFDLVRTALRDAAPGKLVNLAMFDVSFPGRPTVPPIVTLTWKDWKGGEPTIEFPRRTQSGQAGEVPPAALPVPPAQAAVLLVSPPQAGVPPGSASHPIVASLPQPATSGFPPPRVDATSGGATATAAVPVHEASVVIAPDPVASIPPHAPETPVAALDPASGGPAGLDPAGESLVRPALVADSRITPQPKGSPTPTGRRGSKPSVRLRGDELIADLFEAMHDLHFLRDAVEGADFCLTLALEKIPSRVGIVHLYDIDRREFVVACVRGPNQQVALLQRYPESDPILSAAMRRQRAMIWADSEETNAIERYRIFGGARSLLVAPVMLAGRFLGALELLDPVDGLPFNDEEGYALTYIGEQFAEFVAMRGVTVDPERIAGSSRG
jgi:hypothetical protein